MSLSTSLKSNLPGIYVALADTKATYNGSDIDVFYEDDYEVSEIKDRKIKVQTSDVLNLVTGENISMDSKSYEVINFNQTDDGLETLIALKEV